MLQSATSSCSFSDPVLATGAPAFDNQNFAFTKMDCTYGYTYSTTTQFTSGEAVISFFLFFLLIFTAFAFFLDRIVGVRIRKDMYNTIIGNNSQEGKKIYHD